MKILHINEHFLARATDPNTLLEDEYIPAAYIEVVKLDPDEVVAYWGCEYCDGVKRPSEVEPCPSCGCMMGRILVEVPKEYES